MVKIKRLLGSIFSKGSIIYTKIFVFLSFRSVPAPNFIKGSKG